ncbi:PEP-CTERM sorting domain-containing protein [Tsuneonella sp. HG094]|jgi:hypothetical protein
MMRLLLPLFVLLFASPAAAAGTAVSEPSSLVLFALGVLGVIVGRQSSRRKRD